MKLTLEQVEAKLAQVWGQVVYVVPHRISGNRYRYLATEHGDHWLPPKTSWAGRRQVFVPEERSWPQPETLSWEEAAQWKPGATNKDKTRGLALAYVDLRHHIDRLNEVTGADWSDA